MLGFVATVAWFRDHAPFQLGLWNWDWTWILAQCLLVGGEERSHTARALSKRAGFFSEEALRVLVCRGVEDWFGAGLESDHFLFAAWGPLLAPIWIVSWGEVIVCTFSWNGSLIVIVGHCCGHLHLGGDVASNHTWTTNGLLVGHKLGFGLHLLLRVFDVWVLEIWICQRWQTLNLLECEATLLNHFCFLGLLVLLLGSRVIIHGHVLVGWLGGVNTSLGGGPLLLLLVMMIVEVFIMMVLQSPYTSMLTKFDNICIVRWYVLILNDREWGFRFMWEAWSLTVVKLFHFYRFLWGIWLWFDWKIKSLPVDFQIKLILNF